MVPLEPATAKAKDLGLSIKFKHPSNISSSIEGTSMDQSFLFCLPSASDLGAVQTVCPNLSGLCAIMVRQNLSKVVKPCHRQGVRAQHSQSQLLLCHFVLVGCHKYKPYKPESAAKVAPHDPHALRFFAVYICTPTWQAHSPLCSSAAIALFASETSARPQELLAQQKRGELGEPADQCVVFRMCDFKCIAECVESTAKGRQTNESETHP